MYNGRATDGCRGGLGRAGRRVVVATGYGLRLTNMRWWSGPSIGFDGGAVLPLSAAGTTATLAEQAAMRRLGRPQRPLKPPNFAMTVPPPAIAVTGPLLMTLVDTAGCGPLINGRHHQSQYTPRCSPRRRRDVQLCSAAAPAGLSVRTTAANHQHATGLVSPHA